MIRTDVKTLRAAFERVLPLIEHRNTIPILSTARLTAEAGTLTVKATDLDMEMEVEALVEVTTEGQACLSPHQALRILRLLPRLDAVELTIDGPAAYLGWKGGRARIGVLPVGDFPDLAVAGDRIETPFGEGDFQALSLVYPFISNEETRYYLNGICLDRWDEIPVAVATDGSRLCAMPFQPAVVGLCGDGQKPIIPRKTVSVAMALKQAEAKVALYRRNESPPIFELCGDGIHLRSKTIDGTYPDWKRVLPPADAKLSMIVDRPELLRAATIVSRFVPHAGLHQAVLVADNGRLQVQAKYVGEELAIDLGEISPALKWEVGINAHYIKQALNAVRGRTVTLESQSDQDPIRVTDAEPRAGEHLVIMPLRSFMRTSFEAPLKEAA